MTTKQKVSLAVVALLTAFATGRYTVPIKTKIEVKTVEVEKKSTTSDVDKNLHKDTTITVVKQKDGTEVSTTRIITDSNSDAKSKTVLVDDKSSDTLKEVTRGSSPVTVLALAGVNPSGLKVTYGMSVSKSVFGPISIGAFGIMDGTVGAGIGLQF